MKTKILIFAFFLAFVNMQGQEKVSFTASDGLTVYANMYEVDENLPYIILFHQAGYSKGEYKNSAVKLLKLGYNCLAVDLRSGDAINFIQNETALVAKEKGLPATMLDAEKDMIAAIDWAYARSKKKVVLFGSSYSASLALKIARTNSNVSSVVAFSPGEYFQNDLVVKDALMGFDKTVFVACSQREFSYMSDLLKGIPENLLTVFKPHEGAGEHGSKALWPSNATSNEYWLALLLHFKALEKKGK